MKILITGGTGFVGSQLYELLGDTHDITVIDNLLSGDEPPNLKFIYADIRNANVMDKLIPQFDTVVHLAAIVGEPACVINPLFAYDTNVNGTRNILAAMTNKQRIIFTSTSSVYGNRPNERVTEESQPIPLNHYAQHKYTAEKDIIASGIPYVIVRPVTAFGVTAKTRMDLLVNNLIYEALSQHRIEVYEPNIMRPIIHVIDFARILTEAINGTLGINQVYNIGDPRYNVTKLELATLIAKMIGAQIKLAKGSSLDPRDYDVAFDKLIATGFTFATDRLHLAISQISAVKDQIDKNRDIFTTPYKVKLFLERNSKGV